MHPILARTARLGLYLLAWVPLAAITGGLLAFAGPLTALEAALLAPPLALVYAFLCLSSWYLCKVFPLESPRVAAMATTYSVASIIAGSLWVLWAATVGSALAMIPAFVTLPDRLPRATPIVFLLGVLLYLLVVALHYVVFAVMAARARVTREAELVTLAREAELKALKDQINPHFLFNALNSISALTSSDPARAREMCVLLADFLRKTLGLSDRTSISLREEIALLHNYLAIERVRFGDRLSVEEEIDDRAGDCPVPPLLLQPLLENAVKHGIASSVDGGSIRLKARRRNGSVTIDVENALDPDAPVAPGTGLGLQNVRRRLAARWGENARMHEHRVLDLFRVEITFPFDAVPANPAL